MTAHQLRLSGVVEESIVDGPGLRFVIFTQGCPHQCPGCHNPKTHPFTGGFCMDIETIFEQFQENPLLDGITFSGGEPFMQAAPLVQLAKKIHSIKKHITIYTGYVFENLLKMSKQNHAIIDLLTMTDLLIDGPFLLSQKNLELSFRGSANQRLLDQQEMQKLIQQC
ncbi:anaerobic ribonucleoside-triphosphate reductase activating protein [Commensalibacter papalotli (ex Botero et al. 2024)]|uniref:Anaerobic ribonucleoside-triphosphate reductase-activating protein n=1 Tax=Commensalibacter papalotli (ex Botero et al. 2024) TaxID=2972766 RepID=A0ABM9HST9_9PROT|nr:anaerobic ribonucleoside-triphosphate reductase activating protein [Commensalibacter papalotli (ex Botero et al. 2024)]CAI3951677.1 Pyruvate-formate lyase-activating enzyme (PflA) (PDB:3CAN) [Commensalibacter papalotli (ex Botero et al. 2024)]CAI3955614.1 Pyruvate-formate lyase-activating enzyme (PflA) (PDB:3CAN) [Commensalibacter papalotli (ex Botero et al. 2024)]